MTGLRMGAHTEYVTVPVSALVRQPVEVQHEFKFCQSPDDSAPLGVRCPLA